jgi:hypothetical protein
MKVMDKKSTEAPGNASHEAIEPKGVPGQHAILIFFLCGIFLTAGWGSMTALLTIVLWVGMRKQVPEIAQPSAPECSEICSQKDTSTNREAIGSPT